jgi:hypothetical protein
VYGPSPLFAGTATSGAAPNRPASLSAEPRPLDGSNLMPVAAQTQSGREARDGIGSWMNFYSYRRPHQAMNNQFPMAAWRPAWTGSRRRRLCRFAWTTQTRCPHTHSRRKSSSRKLLDLKDKGRRDHTLTSAIPGPSSGLHFTWRCQNPSPNKSFALAPKGRWP